MLGKVIPINGKSEYIRDIPDFFDELFRKGVIDLFTVDTLKEEFENECNKYYTELIDNLNKRARELDMAISDLSDAKDDIESAMDSIHTEILISQGKI